jgi:hypothetical protein
VASCAGVIEEVATRAAKWAQCDPPAFGSAIATGIFSLPAHFHSVFRSNPDQRGICCFHPALRIPSKPKMVSRLVSRRVVQDTHTIMARAISLDRRVNRLAAEFRAFKNAMPATGLPPATAPSSRRRLSAPGRRDEPRQLIEQ